MLNGNFLFIGCSNLQMCCRSQDFGYADISKVFLKKQTKKQQPYTFVHTCVLTQPLLDEEGGLIDRVAQDVFLFLEEKRLSEGAEAIVKVTYMELYREELRDLLEMHPNQKELHIREDKRGNTGNKGTSLKSERILTVFNSKHICSCGSHLPDDVFSLYLSSNSLSNTVNRVKVAADIVYYFSKALAGFK